MNLEWSALRPKLSYQVLWDVFMYDPMINWIILKVLLGKDNKLIDHFLSIIYMLQVKLHYMYYHYCNLTTETKYISEEA